MVGNTASLKLDPSTFALFALGQAHVVSLKSRLNRFIKPLLSYVPMWRPASVALGERGEEEEAWWAEHEEGSGEEEEQSSQFYSPETNLVTHLENEWPVQCALGCPSKTCFFENQKVQPNPVVFGYWFEGSQKDFWFWQLLGGAPGR